MTTPIPVHHDEVLRAVTTIAQTLISTGVPMNFAGAMALSLGKVIQADVELTIEEIIKSIAEGSGSIESPPGEPEGEGVSEEPEYGKTVAEFSGQPSELAKYDNAQNLASIPETEENKELEPEPIGQVSSGREDDEGPKSAERFNFTSLVKPVIEKQEQNEGEEQQAPTNDGLFTGLLRRISGDQAPQADSLQVVSDKDQQIADLPEQASLQSKHDSTEAEKNITPETFPERTQDETSTSALSETETTDGTESATTDQVKSKIEDSEGSSTEGAFDLTSLIQLDSVEKIHVDREVEQPEQELVKDAAINMDASDLGAKLEKMVIELEKMVGVACDSCGSKINSDQTFCPHCGKPKPAINLSSHKITQRDQASEPEGRDASLEMEYGKIVAEFSGQPSKLAEYDNAQNPTSTPETEENNVQKPESIDLLGSELDNEESKSTERFSFESLRTHDTEQRVDTTDETEQPGQEFAEEAAENLAELSAIKIAASDLKKELENLVDVECEFCGEKFTSDHKLCPHCGKLKPAVHLPSQEKSPIKRAEPEQQQKKNRDQICAVCSSPIRPGKKFCTHCGAVRCENCETFVKRDAECSNCHTLL